MCKEATRRYRAKHKERLEALRQTDEARQKERDRSKITYIKYKSDIRFKGILRRHKITKEDYDQMFDKQNGQCLICKIDFHTAGLKNTHIDHCHRTQHIRGLLCNKCNQGLGLFNDQPDLLDKAADYLRNSNG